MFDIGVQTKNVVRDDNPLEGFMMLRDAGFTCCDFSLNAYLYNKNIYAGDLNPFFDKSVEELKEFFTPHKEAAKHAAATTKKRSSRSKTDESEKHGGFAYAKLPFCA